MHEESGRNPRKIRKGKDRGASLVEFALIAPLLLALVFGIVEFGWLFAQNNDVRHGAREAARLAAVDTAAVAAMGIRTCDAMDISAGATVTFTDGAGGAIGDEATVNVTTPVISLTGFYDAMLPGTLTSEVRIRLEQNSDSWNSDSFTCP